MALALVVSPALAAEFDVTLETAGDVSAVDGLQLNHPTGGTASGNITVTVKFAQGVTEVTAFAATYDEDGTVLGFPEVTVAPETASQEKTLTMLVSADTVKVNIRIAAGIESADPINADTSKALDVNVEVLTPDHAAGPRVDSIRRADTVLLPVTAETVQVLVTLSETPKEFKKDHISVTEATVTKDPEPLDPIDPRQRTDPGAPSERDLYDTANGADDGIHFALNDSTPEDLTDAYTAYNTTFVVPTTTVGAQGYATATKKTEINTDGYPFDPPSAGSAIDYGIPLFRPFKKFTIAIGQDAAGILTFTSTNAPSAGSLSFETADLEEIEEAIADAEAEDPLYEDRSVAPTPPIPANFDTANDYTNAVRLYSLRREEHKKYEAELALYNAYLAAVRAEEAKDEEAILEYYEDQAGPVGFATGRDSMLHAFVVTIAPKYENDKDIVVKVKAFEDTNFPVAGRYIPPLTEDDYTEGIDKLTIKVNSSAVILKPGTRGLEVVLAKEQFIPQDGYLVVADDEAGSAIVNPGGAKDAPKADRTPAGLKYNLHANALPNLFAFLSSGGVIDVVSPMDLTITEIMWGTDASLVDDNTKSQWIELHNSSAGANTGENAAATKLIFYGYGQAPALNADGTLPTGVKDRVGTIDSTGIVWSLAGKGQNGRTGVGEEAGQLVAVAPKRALKSMYRLPSVAGEDGTASSSWMQYNGPPRNFDITQVGIRHGTPGADHIVTAADQAAIDAAAKSISDAAAAATAAAAAKAQGTGTIPVNGNIYISEIMVDRGANLPQWIEIANGSRTEEVNLSGWTLTVDNATADADVSVGASITFTIPAGTKIGMFGQQAEPSTLLVVTEAGRTSLAGTLAKGQVLNLWESNQDELILGGVTRRRYSLISEDAFLITLAPPAPVKTVVAPTATPTEKAAARAADARATVRHRAASDVVGNLGADGAAAWALPINAEGGRSSIIRRHIPITRGPAAPEEGDDMEGWALASETSFAQPTHVRAASYYGAANDIGTPGFRAGGALPVELSHFRPARDKVTDAVVITWATQSELNNAGFFIKRSNQANGEFKVVNATIIPGAGTTSEKQFYTYTDTTASPNTVYYYQIEDVSLDGNRQTLTRGIRLKGHVGAAGKATVIWGELKDRD